VDTPSAIDLLAVREALGRITAAAALIQAEPTQAMRVHWVRTIQEQVGAINRCLDGLGPAGPHRPARPVATGLVVERVP
jgi:hypothetical protein